MEIDGKEIRGVVALAPGEKVGHYHIEDYEDKAIAMETEVDDGKVLLEENQLENKYDSIGKAAKDAYKFEAVSTTMDSILKRLTDPVEDGQTGEESGSADDESGK
eukprot:1641052-Alexandrium_andersonii.AAC.1